MRTCGVFFASKIGLSMVNIVWNIPWKMNWCSWRFHCSLSVETHCDFFVMNMISKICSLQLLYSIIMEFKSRYRYNSHRTPHISIFSFLFDCFHNMQFKWIHWFPNNLSESVDTHNPQHKKNIYLDTYVSKMNKFN